LAGKKNEDRDATAHRHIVGGIISIAFAIYILFCIFPGDPSTGKTGLLGVYLIKGLLEMILGFGVFLMPIILTFIGVVLFTKQEPTSLRIRLIGFSVFFLTYVSAFQMFFPQYYSTATYVALQGGGGFIGYVFTFLLTKVLGAGGTYIALSAMLLISIILSFNITSLDAFMAFIDGILPKKDEEDEEETIKPKKEKIKKPVITLDDKSSIANQMPLIKDDLIQEEKKYEVPISSTPVLEEAPHSSLDDDTKPKKKYKRHTYKLPPLDLLGTCTEAEKQKALKLRELTQQRKIDLERALRSFGVGASVVNISIGPAVTRFEVQPEPGVKVSKIANLADDIALNLASGGVRIEAPILGKAVVGIEVPNPTVTPIHLGEIARTSEFANNPSKLFTAIGKDIAGTPIFGDLAKMPHMLVAGTTGSGKSVAINSLIISILMRARPDEVKFIMIDPKMVELAIYDDIPHLMAPVVTDAKKAAATLKDWVLKEMSRRYKQFFDVGARNLEAYNKKIDDAQALKDPDVLVNEKLPYLVVIIDELADLMMVASNEVETTIARIAQMARATGIHLVVATQRPSVDVITGLIKANIPSRISFAVATQIDSRVVLDVSGAEKLLGRGDMLYSPIGAMKPTRVQGAYVSDDEIEKIVAFVKKQASPEYSEEIINIKYIDPKEAAAAVANGANQQDDLFADAARIVIESGQASTSHLQRRMRIGYNRAARLMDELTDANVVSLPEGDNKARRVLKTMADLHSLGLVNEDSKPEYPKF